MILSGVTWSCPHCQWTNGGFREICRNCGYDSNAGEFPYYNPLPPYEGSEAARKEWEAKEKEYEAREKRLVEEKEQYKTVYTNLCRDLRAERARYIAILQSWKNFDVWAASTVRVPDGQQAVTDAHDELSMKRDAILSEQEKL